MITDGRAAGSSTRRIVAILRLADGVGGLAHVVGDRLQPLAHAETTSGSATSERIAPAAKNDFP